jgi:hypothetical protein
MLPAPSLGMPLKGSAWLVEDVRTSGGASLAVGAELNMSLLGGGLGGLLALGGGGLTGGTLPGGCLSGGGDLA